MKILYADDDFLTSREKDCKDHPYYEALEYALERGGVAEPQIDIATDGAQTYRKLKEIQYDGLILDIMMPPGDNPPQFIKITPFHRVGLVIAEQLSRNQENISIPAKIILLTATPLAEDRLMLENLCKSKSWFFMTKPATFRELATLIIGDCNV